MFSHCKTQIKSQFFYFVLLSFCFFIQCDDAYYITFFLLLFWLADLSTEQTRIQSPFLSFCVVSQMHRTAIYGRGRTQSSRLTTKFLFALSRLSFKSPKIHFTMIHCHFKAHATISSPSSALKISRKNFIHKKLRREEKSITFSSVSFDPSSLKILRGANFNKFWITHIQFSLTLFFCTQTMKKKLCISRNYYSSAFELLMCN